MTVSAEQFRDALRHFPAGVTIVTVQAPGEPPHGLTVSAFASVSPAPPLILVCIDHRATGHALLQRPGAVFAVNILAADQAALSNRFAWVKDGDRFAEGVWGTAVTGLARLYAVYLLYGRDAHHLHWPGRRQPGSSCR